MVTVNVRKLPRSMDERQLDKLFSEHGRVFNLKLAKDIFSGDCKGVAQLRMEGHEARAAREALDGMAIEGNMIQVTVHKPKTKPRYVS